MLKERKYKTFCLKIIRIFVNSLSSYLFYLIHSPYYLYGRSLLLKKMKNDTRFKISDDWLYPNEDLQTLKAFTKWPVKKYELAAVKLKDIKTNGGSPLSGCAQFAYAVNGDKECYIASITNFLTHMDMSNEEIKYRLKEILVRFENTRRSMLMNGYDIHKGIIAVNKNNFILCGTHRSSILWSIYGPDYEITVLRIYYHQPLKFL